MQPAQRHSVPTPWLKAPTRMWEHYLATLQLSGDNDSHCLLALK